MIITQRELSLVVQEVHEKLLETARADTSDVPGKEYSTLIEMLLNLPIFVLLLSTICSNNRSYVSTISP